MAFKNSCLGLLQKPNVVKVIKKQQTTTSHVEWKKLFFFFTWVNRDSSKEITSRFISWGNAFFPDDYTTVLSGMQLQYPVLFGDRNGQNDPVLGFPTFRDSRDPGLLDLGQSEIDVLQKCAHIGFGQGTLRLG